MKRYGRIVRALLSAALILAAACSPPVPSEAPAPVQRWIHEQLSRDSAETIDAPNLAASWSARGARAVENTADGLRLLWGGEAAAMTLTGEVQAADYASFVVRMRISPAQDSGPAEAAFRWRTRLDPEAREDSEHRVPVFRDNVYHTYTFPLRSAGTWTDVVTAIEFVPCDKPGDVDIQQLELVHEPATNPARLTIASETHEAAFGTQSPWTLRVPPSATFETYVGMGPLAWDRKASDGVTFRVLLDSKRRAGIELARERFDPLTREEDRAWRWVQADLSKYAGTEVTVRLEVDHHDTMIGDYAYWGSPAVFAAETAPEDIPVFLVSNDTLRADRLGCYGHDRETSPNLDAFRRDAVLFENAMCAAPWTLPSHMTMLTGLYPKRHKVSHTINLRENIDTLPELLAQHDYLTAAFTGVSGYLSPHYGFSHGFDVYNTPNALRTIEATAPLVTQWLDRHTRGKVFLFFHNFDIHSKPPNPQAEDPYFKLPYFLPSKELRYFATTAPVPPVLRFSNPELPTGTALLETASFGGIRFDSKTIRYLFSLYDDGVRYVDQHLGTFFDALRARDLYDRALIIVTADHGEEFHEHGRYLHTQIHEECQHVPLLIKFPANAYAGESFAPVVSLADIVPTVLDVLGSEALPGIDGQSLLALLKSEATPNDRAFGEHHNQQTVRTSAWRVFAYGETQTPLVYDIAQDKRALKPVQAHHNENALALEQQLSAFFESDRAGWNIQCDSLAGHGTTKLEITAEFDSPVGDVQLLHDADSESAQFDRYERLDGGRRIVASITLFGADSDSLVLLPTGGNRRVQMRIVAEKAIDVAIGSRAQLRSGGVEGVLDASEETFPRPVDIPARLVTAPRVRIWFDEPDIALPAGKDLTDAEREELQALGYLHQ